MDCWKVSIASLVFLFAASSARASSLKPRERAAQKACLLGDYKKGIEILSDLYLDTKDPNYLYNQGRCLEQNGQYSPAILRFEEYLRKAKNLSPAETEDAHKRIDDAQAAIDRRGKPARAEPVPAPAPEPAPAKAIPVFATTPSPAAPAPLVIAQPAPTPEPAASEPVYKRWWFWTGIGTVVAAGVVTAVLLSSKSAAKSPSCDVEGTCVR